MLTKIKSKNRYLIAVSGGADSMFLLEKFKKKDIIVAHVNYNLRPEAIFETLLVAKFCHKNNLKLKILSYDTYKIKGNLQSQLRQVRYQFFQEIYQNFSCTKLLIGHHRDDFLENVFLQRNAQKIVSFWGIRSKNYFLGMEIRRPLLFFYSKKMITKRCCKKTIPFLNDKSNFEPKYRRNQIRILLKNKSEFWKFILFLWYYFQNFGKKLTFFYHKYIFNKWGKEAYSIFFFQKIKNKSAIIFLYVHQNFENIKLSSKKIYAISDFICAKSPNGKFLLKKNTYIIKKKWKLMRKSSKINY